MQQAQAKNSQLEAGLTKAQARVSELESKLAERDVSTKMLMEELIGWHKW